MKYPLISYDHISHEGLEIYNNEYNDLLKIKLKKAPVRFLFDQEKGKLLYDFYLQ